MRCSDFFLDDARLILKFQISGEYTEDGYEPDSRMEIYYYKFECGDGKSRYLEIYLKPEYDAVNEYVVDTFDCAMLEPSEFRITIEMEYKACMENIENNEPYPSTKELAAELERVYLKEFGELIYEKGEE